MIKVVHDIDRTFFNFALRGKVTVRWSRNEGSLCDHMGYTTCTDDGLSQVYLNVDWIYASPDPSDHTWQTLFHELVVSKEDHRPISQVEHTNQMCSTLSETSRSVP